MANFEIRYWPGGKWFGVDEGVLEWLNEIISHPYVVSGLLPDIRRKP